MSNDTKIDFKTLLPIVADRVEEMKKNLNLDFKSVYIVFKYKFDKPVIDVTTIDFEDIKRGFKIKI